MKVVAVLTLFLACATAWPYEYILSDHHYSEAKKQQDINRLLHKVTEPLRKKFSDLKKAAENYHPEEHESSFKDGGKAAAALCKEIKDERTLSKHHWFSLFSERQRKEALMLFEALMNAKDFEAFASSAAYFRERMNEGEFVYGLYTAVIHSDLTQHVILPPLYEVTPHMFTNSEVINKAYSAKMTQTGGVFKMDFTGSKKNAEQRVAYFGEDIGLNVHHVTWHMDYPFWWEDSYGYHLDRKGELFFWVHHQLTARFDAERLSNNLKEVDELYWDKPIAEGFAPHTTYKYGGEFPSRPDNVKFEDVDGVARIRDLITTEIRLRDAIAHGYIVGKKGNKINLRDDVHGIDILGDIIESSMYSPNFEYYGSLHNKAHMVLGRQGDPHGKFNMPPGVMEHFETATRDPAFFRLHKYMDNIFKEHKDSLKPYTAEELIFTGVSIDSVSISGSLETFFEDFEFDLLNAVDDTENLDDVPLKARTSRLNHKPFSLDFSLTNNNDHAVLATVRVFLCPRRDYNGILYSFDEGRWKCIELDKFWRKLATGSNSFSRASSDSSTTVPDLPSFSKLFADADQAVASGGEWKGDQRSCGIPDRLLLPKGKPEGMEFALAVAVTDGEVDGAIDDLDKGEHGGTHAQCGVHGEKYPDNKPLGYPLDRRIPDPRVYLQVPNFRKTVVSIKHNE